MNLLQRMSPVSYQFIEEVLRSYALIPQFHNRWFFPTHIFLFCYQFLTHIWYPWKIRRLVLHRSNRNQVSFKHIPNPRQAMCGRGERKVMTGTFKRAHGKEVGRNSGFLLPGVSGFQPRERATALPARVSSQCAEISASHHIHTQPINPCLTSLQEPQMASAGMFLRSSSKHDQL